MNKNMKYMMTVAVLGIVLAAGLFIAGKAAALNVNDVASDPTAFTGVITVTGVVAGVSEQDPSLIGMMDKKELQCTTPGCNKVYLPFKARNYSPVRGDEVRATGRFETTAGGVIFMADSVTVVKNHRIGG